MLASMMRAMVSDDPRKALADASMWLVAAWLLWHAGAWRLFFLVRTYRSMTDPRNVIKLLKHVRDCPSMSMGSDVVGGRRYPSFIVGWNPRPFVLWTRSEFVFGSEAVNVTVYVLQLVGAEPLVPDVTDPCIEDDPDFIAVIRPVTNEIAALESCLQELPETVTPGGGGGDTTMSPADVARVEAAADDVIADSAAHGRQCRVTCVCGPPRTGKTTLARVVVQRLRASGVDARLFPGYDPTKTGMCLIRAIFEYAGKNTMLVVGMDEFDLMLAKMVKGVAADVGATHHPDAADKADWSTLTGLLGFQKNVIVVMTTNDTREELVARCVDDRGRPDLSWLRHGRVHRWVDFHGQRRTDDRDSAMSVSVSSSPSSTRKKGAWR